MHLIYVRFKALNTMNTEKGTLDNKKFIKEITENKNQMYMVALSLLKNHADAEDVVQEAILIAYEKLYMLKEDDKFEPWIMRIVVNQAKMYIRKNSKIIYSEDVPEKFCEDRHQDIWEIVLSMKSELSAVVILFYEQGNSVKEISKIMDIPVGTVKSRLSKARELLKKELEDFR